jgi:hypothetical protein
VIVVMLGVVLAVGGERIAPRDEALGSGAVRSGEATAEGVDAPKGLARSGVGEARASARADLAKAPGAADRSADRELSGTDPASERARGRGLRIDRPSFGAGAVTTRITGVDAAGPRELVLWRVMAGGAARLARARSDSEGRFDFGEVAIVESDLAVTGVAERPESSLARVRLPALAASAPSAERRVGSAGPAIRIWPSAAAVRVLISNGGRELGSVPVAVRAAGVERSVDLTLAPQDATDTLFVAEEDASGLRSAWQPVEIAR